MKSSTSGSRPSRRGAAFAALGTVLFLATPQAAQEESHEGELRRLRAAFRQSLLLAILPEKRSYAARLGEAEKRLVDAHDYAAATKVRDERLALEQQLTAHEQELPALAARAAGRGALLPERLVFRPQDATLAGLRLEKDGAIAGWESPGAAASWKLPALPAGGYEVALQYACNGGAGSAVEIRESYYLLRGQIRPTGEKTVKGNLGTLRIRDGAGSLTLVAGKGTDANLMRVFALELIPVNR